MLDLSNVIQRSKCHTLCYRPLPVNKYTKCIWRKCLFSSQEIPPQEIDQEMRYDISTSPQNWKIERPCSGNPSMPCSILGLMIESTTSQKPLLHAGLPVLHHHQGGGGLLTDAQQAHQGGVLTSLKVDVHLWIIQSSYLDSSVQIFQHVLPVVLVFHPRNNLEQNVCVFKVLLANRDQGCNHLCVAWKRPGLAGNCGANNWAKFALAQHFTTGLVTILGWVKLKLIV